MRLIVGIFCYCAFFISSTVFSQTSPGDIPLSEFSALPKNSQVELSPDGKNILIITKHQGVRIVLVKPLSNNSGWPGVAFPPQDGMDIRSAWWANNEYILISMSFEANRIMFDSKRNLEGRLMSVPIKKPKKARNMVIPSKEKGKMKGFHTAYGINDRIPVWFSIVDMLVDDPDHFLLELDEDWSDYSTEVRKVNVKTGRYRLIHNPSGDSTGWIADKQGKIRLGYGNKLSGTSLSEVKDVLMYLNPQTGEWVDYSKKEIADHEKYSILEFFDDPQFAYVRKINEHGHWGIYKYDLINLQKIENLSSFEDRDVFLVYDPYDHRPTGFVYDGDNRSVEYDYFDDRYKRIQRIVDKAIPNAINRITSRTQDENLYLIYSYSDVDPGSYYLFDQSLMQLAFVEARYEGLDPRLLSPMKYVSYKARDGLIIHGFLTIPTGSDGKNLPTIIMPHGGPTSHTSWGYDYRTQFLASRGYAVFQPNFRGSTGYGEEFEHAGRREWGLKMQDDVTDGALWLVEQGIADPERMCIFGWSYGGYAALTAAFTTPDLFKCSISINGISNLEKLVYEESGYLAQKEWGKLIGNLREDRSRLKETSAINNIDKIKIPILLIVTKDDTTVNYQQSKRFHKKMKKAGKYSKYVEIKDGNHSAQNELAQTIILENLERFLARYIGGGS